jgi:hypothetical protein
VAVVMIVTMPEGVPISMLDDVAREMDVDNNPPDGLIVHTHSEVGGRVQVVDVWESAEAHQRFEADRLGPAMVKVARARELDMSQFGEPDMTMNDIHMLVRGR